MSNFCEKKSRYKTSKTLHLLPVLAMFSAPVLALPFAPVEPVSYALGGTGVASASNVNAGLFNPALLAANQGGKAVLPPTLAVGYRYYDLQNVMDAVYSYQRIGVEAAYNTELANYRTTSSSDDDNQSLADIRSAASGIRSRFPELADKSVQQEYVAAIAVAIPHEKLNISFSLSRKMQGGALVDITENDLNELDRIIEQTAGDADPPLSKEETFDSSQFTSRFRGRGMMSTELGLSIARNYTFAGHEVAVGVTPKFILATSFDYVESIGRADFETDLGQKDSSAFDVDVGVAKSYGNGWSAGFSIKNLIGQKYKTSLGNEIRIKPQGRIGVSHSMKWAVVAVDLDLNKSESFGYESQTQYLGIGAELNIFDMSSVRIGYRSNLSDATTSIATVGLGLHVYGVQVDLALGANEDEFDVAASFGYQF